MAAPTLASLINSLTDQLQLEPQRWTNTGALTNAPELRLMDPSNNPQGVSAPNDFRSRDVEPLLEQASAMLDRSLLDRAAFQQAGEKFATFTLDISRKISLVGISDNEINNDHRFEVPYQLSKGRYDSQQRMSQGLADQVNAGSFQTQALNNLTTRSGNISGWEYALEYLMLSEAAGPNPTQFNYPGPQSQVGGGGPISLSGQHGARVDQGSNIARALSDFQIAQQVLSMRAEMAQLSDQKDALDQQTAGLQAQMNWDDANRGYLARRADLDKAELILELAMAQVTWLLDFRSQMKSIAPRYRQTVVDAYDRLKAVDAGMMSIYGRRDVQGNPVDPLPQLTDEMSVDSIIGWTRRIATWLLALSRRSSNYVFPISVKKRAAAGWAAGQRTRSWTFTLPIAEFPGQSFVRIRGIAVWVSGGTDGTVWTVRTTLPDITTLMYEQGLTQIISQGQIECIACPVQRRADKLTPTVIGTTTCYNASPTGTGDWTVGISDAYDPNSPATPDDIQIDVYLSAVFG